jgi:hypothetical protein
VPPEKIAAWPVVGKRVHAIWSQAHIDLPGRSRARKLVTKALGIVAARSRQRQAEALWSVFSVWLRIPMDREHGFRLIVNIN